MEYLLESFCVQEGYILDMSKVCALKSDKCAFIVLNVYVAYIGIIEYKRPANIGDAMIEMAKDNRNWESV